MSIVLYTVTNSRISRSYHVENWTAALRQLARTDYIGEEKMLRS